MRPHSRRMEKAWVKKAQTRLYCRPRKPNRDPTAVEWKSMAIKAKYWA